MGQPRNDNRKCHLVLTNEAQNTNSSPTKIKYTHKATKPNETKANNVKNTKNEVLKGSFSAFMSLPPFALAHKLVHSTQF